MTKLALYIHVHVYAVSLSLLQLRFGYLLYSKTCLKPSLKKKTILDFKTDYRLLQGQKYCRMLQGEHSAILSTYIKLPLRLLFCLFLSGRLRQVLLYTTTEIDRLFCVRCRVIINRLSMSKNSNNELFHKNHCYSRSMLRSIIYVGFAQSLASLSLASVHFRAAVHIRI